MCAPPLPSETALIESQLHRCPPSSEVSCAARLEGTPRRDALSPAGVLHR